jgi:hypothetical protein
MENWLWTLFSTNSSAEPEGRLLLLLWMAKKAMINAVTPAGTRSNSSNNECFLPGLVEEGTGAFVGEGAGTPDDEGVILAWNVWDTAWLNTLMVLRCAGEVVAAAVVVLTVLRGQSLEMSTFTHTSDLLQSRGLSRRSIYRILGKSVIMARRFTFVRLLFLKMRTSTQDRSIYRGKVEIP